MCGLRRALPLTLITKAKNGRTINTPQQPGDDVDMGNAAKAPEATAAAAVRVRPPRPANWPAMIRGQRQNWKQRGGRPRRHSDRDELFRSNPPQRGGGHGKSAGRQQEKYYEDEAQAFFSSIYFSGDKNEHRRAGRWTALLFLRTPKPKELQQLLRAL